MDADHVVFVARKIRAEEPREHFWCKRCDAIYAPALPVAVTVFSAMGKAFTDDHADCEEKSDAPKATPAGS